jgi:hypothetical protein
MKTIETQNYKTGSRLAFLEKLSKEAQLNVLEKKNLEESLPWIENAILKIDEALKSHNYGFKYHLLKLRRKALLKEYRLIRQLLNR